MNNTTVSCEGVARQIKNHKPPKAAEPDDIPLMQLKESAKQIVPAITLLFLASLDQGNTSSTWRKTIVVPIIKNGSKSDAGNYRPTNLTHILCKLCERILPSTILGHLANVKILYDTLYCFKKRRSCDTYLCHKTGR